MLERLYVKNIALIEEAEIIFDKRLNVLSGETGSGKSVILDSINFVLGSKADKSMIRYGEEEAMVKAEFIVDGDSAVRAVLDEYDIETDDTVVISRRFKSDGKGSIKINGSSVTASMLKRVASHLVDVHGQSEHFFLLSENNQLSVVDSLCGEKLKPLKEELVALLSQKREYLKQIEELGGSESARAQRLDLLRYQINEIESADIRVGETELLKAKKKLFDNAEKVLGAVSAVGEILTSDDGCVDLLNTALRQFSPIAELDEEYSKLCERLDNLCVEAEDVGQTISDIAENFGFDAAEAQMVDERLSLLRSLVKKYGQTEEDILAYLENAKEQYDALNDAADRLVKINSDIKTVDKKIFSLCVKMTELRKEVSLKFCAETEAQLKTLNIPNARFYVEFEPYAQDGFSVSASGADKICFMFSANKGEPPKPLGKVISGGEMSRFMLAIKTQLKGLNGISTYIFDEIDAGISGQTARSVAEKFIAISDETQIIAVSHLPQVCAAASEQFLIFKSDDASGKTVTHIKKLSGDERVDEIVRLTGSIVTDAARTHAKELLKQFDN